MDVLNKIKKDATILNKYAAALPAFLETNKQEKQMSKREIEKAIKKCGGRRKCKAKVRTIMMSSTSNIGKYEWLTARGI